MKAPYLYGVTIYKWFIVSVWYVAGFVNVMYAHVHMDICIKLATDSNVNVVHVLSTASQ